MIIIRDTLWAERRGVPPWMAGASVHCMEDDQRGHLYGIGDRYLLGPGDAATRWDPVGDGYDVRLVPPLYPAAFLRPQLWCDMLPAKDLERRLWAAPVILTRQGERAFRVAYGPDYLPALSPTQDRALAVAREARLLLQESAKRGGLDSTLAARYTAELLSRTHFLAPAVIGALRLLDDALILDTLAIAAGFRYAKQ